MVAGFSQLLYCEPLVWDSKGSELRRVVVIVLCVVVCVCVCLVVVWLCVCVSVCVCVCETERERGTPSSGRSHGAGPLTSLQGSDRIIQPPRTFNSRSILLTHTTL